jgi:hypothetical protein
MIFWFPGDLGFALASPTCGVRRPVGLDAFSSLAVFLYKIEIRAHAPNSASAAKRNRAPAMRGSPEATNPGPTSISLVEKAADLGFGLPNCTRWTVSLIAAIPTRAAIDHLATLSDTRVRQVTRRFDGVCFQTTLSFRKEGFIRS